MDTPSPAVDDLVPSRELNEPQVVRAVLAVMGFLLAGLSAYFYFTAEAQLNVEIESQIGMPLAEFRQFPADVTSIVDHERDNVLTKRHAAFASVIAAGAVFLLLALATRRRLLGSVTVAALALVIAAVLFGVLAKRKRDVDSGDPAEQTPQEMKVEKLATWVCIGITAVSLVWAGKIAVGYRRRMAVAALP
jgi:drug/metabolite transporter (DMT)-like permease